MNLFELVAKISLDKSEYEKGLSDAKEEGKSFGDRLGGAFGTVAKAGAVVGGAAVAAGGAIYGMATKAAGATDRVDKMSQKLGLSRTAFQELDFVASQSGTSVEGLRGGMKTLTTAMSQASQGGKSQIQMFDKLGVSIYDSNGNLKDQETMLFDTITALQGMEDGTEKTALANQLLGKSGSELMPLLNGEAGSMDAMRKQAHDLGLVLSDETIDAGVKLTDTIDQTKRAFEAITTNVGAQVMPLVQRAFEFVLQNMPMIQEVIGKVMGVFETFVTAVTDGINKYIMPTVGSIIAFIKDVFAGDWDAAWEEVKNIFKNAWNGLTDFAKDIFGKVVDTIKEIDWLEVGSNILEKIKEALGAIVEWAKGLFTNVTDVIKGIDWTEVGHKIWEFISDAFSGVVDWFLSLFGGAKDGIGEGIDWAGLGAAMWDYIKSAFGAVVETLSTIFSDAWTAISQIDWVGLGTAIWDFIISAFGAVKEWATEKFEFLAQVIKEIDWLAVGNKIWDTIISAFNFVAKWAKEKFEFLAQKIKDVDWKGVGTFLWDTIKSGVTAVAAWATKLGEKIAEMIKKIDWKAVGQHLWDTIKSGVTAVVSWAAGIGRDISDTIKKIDWKAVGEALWDGIKNGVGYVVKGAGTVVAWAGNFAGEIVSGITKVDWQDVGDKIWSGIKQGVGYVTKGVGTVVSWAKNFAGEIVDGLFSKTWSNIGSDIWEGIKSGFTSVTDFFTNLLDFSRVPIKFPHITVTDWWDIGPVSIPWGFDVQWYKKAYDNPFLLTSPAILGGYGFGDRGAYQGGEMVYSHDKLMQDIREASRGDVTINVYQQPGEDPEELAERINRILSDDYDRREAATA